MKIIKALTIASALWVLPAQAMTWEEYNSLTPNGYAAFMCLAEFYETLPAGSNPDKVHPKDVSPAYDCYIAHSRTSSRTDLERAKRDLSRELERAEDKRREELDTLIMRMNRQNSIRGSDYYRENMRTKIYHK